MILRYIHLIVMFSAFLNLYHVLILKIDLIEEESELTNSVKSKKYHNFQESIIPLKTPRTTPGLTRRAQLINRRIYASIGVIITVFASHYINT